MFIVEHDAAGRIIGYGDRALYGDLPDNYIEVDRPRTWSARWSWTVPWHPGRSCRSA